MILQHELYSKTRVELSNEEISTILKTIKLVNDIGDAGNDYDDDFLTIHCRECAAWLKELLNYDNEFPAEIKED